jgi:hypothetical protein
VDGCAVCLHGLHDCGGDFVARGVWEADVEDGPAERQQSLATAVRCLPFVVRSHGDCLVNSRQNVLLHEFALAQDPDGRAIAVKESAVLSQLLKLHFRHRHEGVDFMLRALEVLDAKGIDGHHLDASLVAHLQYLTPALANAIPGCRACPYSGQRLETQIVPFYGFDVVVPGKAPVAVHDKCDMLWYGALLERANEEFS